jgi:hypothetical protein
MHAPADPSRPLIDDLELARAVMATDGIECAVAQVKPPGKKQPKKLVSCTGGIFFGRRGEAWPIDDHGLPLMPWIQIVECSTIWNRVHCKKAVCFFISETFGYWDQGHSTTDHGQFVVREYDERDRLAPLARPALLKGHRFRRIKWQKSRDYALLLKYKHLFSPRVIAALKRDRTDYPHCFGTKIQGWPTTDEEPGPNYWDLQLAVRKNLTLGGKYYAWLQRDTNGWMIYSNALDATSAP